MLKHCIKLYFTGTLLFLLNLSNASAQQVPAADSTTIQKEGYGIVLDEFRQPLEGVQILSTEGNILMTTPKNGLFSLESFTSGQKLSFILKDHKTVTIVVQDNKKMTVRLYESYLKFPEKSELLYDEKDASEILGSVASVYTQQLTSTPTPLYLNALTGRIPGFYTQEVSGFRIAKTTAISTGTIAGYNAPNDATAYKSSNSDNSEVGFNLRGQSPVTIVDGIQRDIYSLDPESIESISVLKDALSCLLLGQKSSRGVLMVTTKKGITGPPKVSFTCEMGVQNRLQTPNPLSSYQYAYLYNEALENSGKNKAFSAETIQAFREGNSPYIYPNVNWYNTITRDNAPISKYNLNVNGGIKNARYSVSVSYLNQYGMFKTNDDLNYNTNLKLDRYLINSSVDIDITKNLTVGMQLFGRIQEGYQPGAGTSTVLNSLYSTPNSVYPVFNPDHSYGGASNYTSNLYQLTAGSGYLLDNSRDLMANLDLKYKFTNWLPGLYTNFKVNMSSTSSSLITRVSQQPVYDYTLNPEGEGVYTRYGTISDQTNSFSITSTVQTFYSQGALGYDVHKGDHQLSAKIFADAQRLTFQYDLPESYYNFAATGSYNYKQKYFAEGAINYAGFDRYEPGHQFGTFYAAGLGWNVTEEPFMKENLSGINLLKIRGTYGQTGNSNENAAGYFTWRSAFGQDGANLYLAGTSYGYVIGITEKTLPNSNLTWEKAHKLDIGMDLAVFKSHLNVTFDYYRDVYYDLLQQRGKTIALMGITYPNENIGKNLYTGQELQVTYQNKVGEINFFITANASRMKTEVLNMDELKQNYSWNEHTHQPVGQMFGYVAKGLIQTQEEADNAPLINNTTVHPGDVKLVDLNNDGIIDQFDQTAIGNTKPIIYYGSTLGFSYKGFDFSILLQGVMHRSYMQIDYPFGYGGTDQGYNFLIGRWTPENATKASYPRLTIGNNANNHAYSSYWVHSGDYFRVKNISLGYNLPEQLCNRLKVSGLRIFFNGQNLFTQTSYNRLDPEINSTTAYPMQRINSVGINIKL